MFNKLQLVVVFFITYAYEYMWDNRFFILYTHILILFRANAA